MPNHFHTVWKINESQEKSDFQRNMLKFTGQTILRALKLKEAEIYKSLYVGAKDRHYQFWERRVWIFGKLYGCIERIDYAKRFAGKSFAVGDQKVCTKSILKFKY